MVLKYMNRFWLVHLPCAITISWILWQHFENPTPQILQYETQPAFLPLLTLARTNTQQDIILTSTNDSVDSF